MRRDIAKEPIGKLQRNSKVNLQLTQKKAGKWKQRNVQQNQNNKQEPNKIVDFNPKSLYR